MTYVSHTLSTRRSAFASSGRVISHMRDDRHAVPQLEPNTLEHPLDLALGIRPVDASSLLERACSIPLTAHSKRCREHHKPRRCTKLVRQPKPPVARAWVERTSIDDDIEPIAQRAPSTELHDIEHHRPRRPVLTDGISADDIHEPFLSHLPHGPRRLA